MGKINQDPPLYPLQFTPIYKSAIWGGDRIAKRFKRPKAPPSCGESWEISDRLEGMSVVENGAYRGMTLHALIQKFGEKILGIGRKDQKFPLLIKLIDAKEALSVQVHPSEETSAITQGEPKTEMWFVLEGGPIFAGLKNPISPKELLEAIKKNEVPNLLRELHSQPGDVIFIPGGRIHAIGAGCLILEVQQNSSTTYRVYDWNRIGADGKRRELHIEKALQCIKFDDDNNPIVLPTLKQESGDFRVSRLIENLFFSIEKIDIPINSTIASDPKTFQIFFSLSGPSVGTCMLLPAMSSSLELKPGSFLRIWID